MAVDNSIVLVTGAPLTTVELNQALSTWNGLNYLMVDLKFLSTTKAFFYFTKTPIEVTQKLNHVLPTQAALGADKAAELTNGFQVSGVYIHPSSLLYVAYQKFTGS